MLFRDRQDAGQQLAGRLQQYSGNTDVIVLALPRGGVPVGYEVARSLHVPLDVFVVRKLGVPGHEELALGAIASGGVRVLNQEVVRSLRIPEPIINKVAAAQKAELERREALYRGGLEQPNVKGKTVLLVDDGLATGSTMRAAAVAVRALGARHVVVAVPVASDETCSEFRREVDEVICAFTPEPFHAVGQWYGDFAQTTDDDVRRLLLAANRDLRPAA